jgi:hypothetical protein
MRRNSVVVAGTAYLPLFHALIASNLCLQKQNEMLEEVAVRQKPATLPIQFQDERGFIISSERS